MPSITEDTNAPAKILLIGKSGSGKTGGLASLVAAGYNLRITDTDKGIRTLRSLLTDERYPYAKLIKAKGIDLNKAVRYVPIDTSMQSRRVTRKLPNGNSSTEVILAPANAGAWLKAIDLLDEWKEGDVNLGSIRDWTPQDVHVTDSFSTLAQCAFYFNQSMNARLGAREEGFDYQRDIGGAQSQLRRYLELIYDSSIKCNIIIISHITWVDESPGVATRPKEPAKTADGENIAISAPDGYPSAIGRALSPHMGKYFNDVYVARMSGSGANVVRTISTVSQSGVLAKNSVYLEREYPTATALAEIFAALRGTPSPKDIIDACASRRATPGALPPPSPRVEPKLPTSALA